MAGDIEIDSSSSINVLGLGYHTHYTYDPGNPSVPTTSGGASGSDSTGSYGGLGYKSDSSNALYGDFRNPNEVGSGGDDHRGGGLVRLIATNLILDGSINANGSGSSATNNYGAGSGGGIYIDVQNLSSSAGESASITANGGQAYQAGGGGRIAIYYENLNNFNFDGVIAAGGNGNGTRDGGAGTVYLQEENQIPVLKFDNNSLSGSQTPVWFGDRSDFSDDPSFYNLGLEVLDGADFLVEGNTRFVIDDLAITGAGSSLSILDLEIGNNLTIDGSSAYLEVDNLTVGQKLALKNGAVLYSHTTTMSEVHKLTINATDIEIDSSSSINVLGLGYHTHYTYDPANPSVPTTSGGASGSDSTGSYGGLGYKSDSSNALYGDFRNPNEVGSGGDDYRGGGLVRLIATNLILDGSINANGSGSSGTGNYGAGSGGGIYIDVQNLSSSAGENASITANGGQAYQAGGGGRIAIYYENLNNFNFDGVIAAGGNGHGTRDGGAGTVYLQEENQIPVLKFDNNSLSGSQTPVWFGDRSDFSDDPSFYNLGLEVLDGADFLVEGNTRFVIDDLAITGAGSSLSILNLEIGNNLTIDGSSAYLEVDNLTVGQKLALKNGAVLYSHTTNP